MLKLLRIQNFAIIESVEIEFGPGLNILSGETGAGKSIIMDALNLILGGRASTDLIRSGSQAATVEALFEIDASAELTEVLDTAGIEYDNDELIVRRIIQSNGKSRVFINGALVNISTLGAVTERLVDLCSQGDQRLLNKREEQLMWLDRYGQLDSLCAFVREKFSNWKEKLQELQRLEADSTEREQRTDFLRFQLKDLEAADLGDADEDETIKNELDVLSNAETLYQFAQEAEAAIYGSDTDNAAIMDTLGRLVHRAEEMTKMDQNLAPAYELMNSLKVTLEEAGYFFRDYIGSITMDEERLDELNSRYNQLTQLKRKFGPSLADVIDTRDKFSREIESYENHDESLQIANASLSEAREMFDSEAVTLSDRRKESAKQFCSDVEHELAALNMKRARFETAFSTLEEPSELGIDQVEFLLAANPGEPPQPIQKVASGGELSRIMLALHNVISARGGIRVYLFDEVDSGVSGKTAAIVGLKLKAVAANNQVICITHLPQVASFADRHFRVEKSVRDENGTERTVSSVSLLEGDDRTLEIARMLGGLSDSDDEALANAEAMITAAGASSPAAEAAMQVDANASAATKAPEATEQTQ